ncbi:hypothetical protein [Ekhidna sp. To15]|uniref:hypothetical protein n=1 Tax=Ekhidna sp. To15 TaxID=3395267 RepID=UPI003F51C416
MDKLNFTISGLLFLLFPQLHFAQSTENTLPFDEIYAYGMDANVTPIFDLIKSKSEITEAEKEFVEDFQKRFGGDVDSGKYASSGDLEIDQLLSIFREYWRKSLLDPESNYMMDLGKEVIPFLIKNYSKFNSPTQRDSLGNHLADYIRSKGFHTTEQVNPQGRLVDLIIWREQVDSVFTVSISKTETTKVNVVMMDDFVSLGWIEYATLGRHHPGGWTTEDALYCVIKSYELESESFNVSYLAHEARHFLDKQLWPDLSAADLEYRSKLTELSLAKKSTHELIDFFINNSNVSSENGHQVANHYLIQGLSNKLFDNQSVRDISRWEKVKFKKINKAAVELLKAHTNLLDEAGTEAQNIIAEQ